MYTWVVVCIDDYSDIVIFFALYDLSHASTQVEFADVILLNKTDKASPKQLNAVEAFIKKLNQVAKVYRTCHSDVPLKSILNTHLFDMTKAQVRKKIYISQS